MGKFVCRACGSDQIQGTFPAWFTVNGFVANATPLGPAASIGVEIEWGDGYCPDCDASGRFSDVARLEG